MDFWSLVVVLVFLSRYIYEIADAVDIISI